MANNVKVPKLPTTPANTAPVTLPPVNPAATVPPGGWTGASTPNSSTAGSATGAPTTGSETELQFQQMPVSPYLNYSGSALAPQSSPALWGLNVNGPDSLYVNTINGTTPVPSGLRFNRLLGDIADKLGVVPKKGHSLQEQIEERLVNMYGVDTESPTPGHQTGLQQAASAMGIDTSLHQPGASITTVGAKTPKAAVPSDMNLFYQIAGKLGVSLPSSTNPLSKDSTLSKAAVAKQIYGMNGSQIQQLKALLYVGGFYDHATDTTAFQKDIDGTKLDPYTMKAFGNLLNQAADAYHQGNKVSWDQFLSQAAGKAHPNLPNNLTIQQVLANPALSGSATTVNTPTAPQATGDQLLSSLQTAFENNLGRMPTAAELNQFVSQFDQMQINHTPAAAAAGSAATAPGTFDYETGLTLAPGVPRVAPAATSFARSDTTDYEAHQVANAGAMMLNVIRGAGMGGTPNQVNAG